MAATGSRFYSPSKLGRGGIGVTNGLATPFSPTTAGASDGSDPFAREMGGRVQPISPIARTNAAAVEAAAQKKKKRISVDMVGKPKGFQCVSSSSSFFSPSML
jgi:hypothetical protein